MDASTNTDFENSTTELPRSPASQNFKFQRPDWALFRTVEGREQKAGVAKHKLPRLVMKEITDNALDEGRKARIGVLPDGGYFVEDDGGGIEGTPAEVARLFSISRPLLSTKLLRLWALVCGQRHHGQVIPGSAWHRTASISGDKWAAMMRRVRAIWRAPQTSTDVLRLTEGCTPKRPHSAPFCRRKPFPARF
jgi:hypothetical protein